MTSNYVAKNVIQKYKKTGSIEENKLYEGNQYFSFFVTYQNLFNRQ